MLIGVPRESQPDETRVALVPETVKRLKRNGFSIRVESGAGFGSAFDDASYEAAGAEISSDRSAVLGADLVTCINPLEADDVALLKEGGCLLGFLRPSTEPDFVKTLVERKSHAFSFDLVPRITRAQAMDVLSSMATVAGYRATLMGAEACPKFWPMLMTAAGTIKPANVLVVGAGVAGLQAIATAKRLGAVVWSYDIRPEVKEQIESLGARFVELEGIEGGATEGGYAKEQSKEQQAKQAELLGNKVAECDVVITTAAIPGRPAPKIIDAATVHRMARGSVVVDIAAETGGNCELTQAGQQVVTEGGVTILGPVNLAASMPQPASQMYSRNIAAILPEFTKDGELNLDLENEVVDGSLFLHGGKVRHEATAKALGMNVEQGGAS
ncbi:MAG: Re/Si-specific NAD(P)(+) transhydrogenase subunit alpha [Acidobacteriota bacterium]